MTLASNPREMPSRIYKRPISFYPGCPKDCWFVEVQTPDKQWHDVGNAKTDIHAQKLLALVRIVGNSWAQD